MTTWTLINQFSNKRDLKCVRLILLFHTIISFKKIKSKRSYAYGVMGILISLFHFTKQYFFDTHHGLQTACNIRDRLQQNGREMLFLPAEQCSNSHFRSEMLLENYSKKPSNCFC